MCLPCVFRAATADTATAAETATITMVEIRDELQLSSIACENKDGAGDADEKYNEDAKVAAVAKTPTKMTTMMPPSAAAEKIPLLVRHMAKRYPTCIDPNMIHSVGNENYDEPPPSSSRCPPFESYLTHLPSKDNEGEVVPVVQFTRRVGTRDRPILSDAPFPPL